VSEAQPPTKLAYRPGLDGLRAVAALLVMFVHCRVPGFSGGVLGVDVFFVLSGYLITSILKDHAARGRLNFVAFEMARVRRLVPALLAMLATYALVAPWLFPAHAAGRWKDVLLAATYTMDFGLLDRDLGRPLGHTWTLAIEAQFYLVWPFAMLLISRLRSPARALLIAWGAATFLRIGILAATHDVVRSQYCIDAHCSGLLLGAALAFAPAPRGLGWLGAAVLALLVTTEAGDQISLLVWRISAAELAAALIISDLVHPGSRFEKVFSWEPLRRLGLISYALYLWHQPIARLLEGAWWAPRLFATATLSIGIASLSYLTVERWGKRLLRAGGPAAVSHA